MSPWRTSSILPAVLTLAGLVSSVKADVPGGSTSASKKLAVAGTALVKQHCYKCHGVAHEGDNPAFNVLDRESLLDPRRERKYVVRGKPDDSYIWQRVRDDEMPPGKEPKLGADEKKLLKEWVSAGAPKPEATRSRTLSEKDTLAAIQADLSKTDPTDRPFQRYYTLTHLYNQNDKVSDFDLRLYRAALSKAVNSLSQQPDIHVPTAIDAEQSIYRVDLRKLGWTPKCWQQILRQYPYGLAFDASHDRDLAKRYQDVTDSGSSLPYVRADWFIATATRPPLYNVLLDVPATDAQLEARLKVNFRADFDNDQLQRAGLVESGVATSNRVLERHRAPFGAYFWRSYDFKQDNRKGNIVQRPLGPPFAGNPFGEGIFQQNGGELIFGLPNGLQGYMLVNEKGQRIGDGPIAVVRDLREASGTPVVVNGLSCMTCHEHGLKAGFQDAVRSRPGVFGKFEQKVQRLYPLPRDMDRIVDVDRKRFLAALEQAIGPFVKVDEDAQKPIEQFPEPIAGIVDSYRRAVGLEEAAYELGVEPKFLEGQVQGNIALQRLGLGPLAEKKTINRAFWDTLDYGSSTFQDTARLLNLGTPLVFK